VAIESSNNCTQKVQQNEVLNIVGGGDIVVSGINFDEHMLVDPDCITSANVFSQSNQKLTQTINQIAKSIVQALGAGVTDASNVVKVVDNLRNSIKESFEQNVRMN
jgi:hypothetical protein